MRRPALWSALLVALLPALIIPGLAYEAVDVHEAGTITGRVVFVGPIPSLPPLRLTKDQESCAAAASPQALLVSPENRGVKNTVISLQGITQGKAPASERPVLDNQDCILTPRVLAVMAGTEIVIQSSDPFLHTTRGRLPDLKQAFNLVFPKQTPPKAQKIRLPGVITVTCDTHPHMRAYILSFAHPYSAVSNARGHFEITQVPPGTYTVQAWHEGWTMLGYDQDGRPQYEEPHSMTTTVTVTAGTTQHIEFQLSARN
jgi:hypothetical protein